MTSPRLGRLVASVLAVGLLASACSGDDAETPATTQTTLPPETTTTTEAPLSAGTRAYVYAPEVGDCLDRRTLPDEEGGDDITLLLDCDLPHELEVFAVVEIDPAEVPRPSTSTTSTTSPRAAEPLPTDDDPTSGTATTTTEGTTPPEALDPQSWPGDDSLIRLGRRICPPLYGEWSGLPYELSELEVGYLLPDEGDWLDGDRTLACTVFDPSGTADAPVRLVGTTRGSGR